MAPPGMAPPGVNTVGSPERYAMNSPLPERQEPPTQKVPADETPLARLLREGFHPPAQDRTPPGVHHRVAEVPTPPPGMMPQEQAPNNDGHQPRYKRPQYYAQPQSRP